MKKFKALDWELLNYDWSSFDNPFRPNRLDSTDALLNELDFLLLERVAQNDSWRLIVSAMIH